jgi:cell division protein FtsL
MNAAARQINQTNIFSGQWSEMRLSAAFCLQMIILFAVLISAISVVYVTNKHRMAMSQLESAQQQSHQLQLQWGQLLLEQASLSTPGRVQQLAEDKLHMVLPTDKQMFILRAQ